VENEASEIQERSNPSEYLEQFKLLEKAGALDVLSDLRNENRELETLIDDATALFALTRVVDLIDYVIGRILDRFIPTHLVFLIESPRGDHLNVHYYHNMKPEDADFPLEYYVPLKDFFLESSKPTVFADIERKMGAERLSEVIRRFEPVVVFPMRGIGGVHGIVLFGKKLVGNDYTNVEIMYADRLMGFLSIAVQNSLHLEESITDSKTGLFNHFYFMKRLEEELARITRHHSRAGVIILDVDHFKHFNDTYGHLAGDLVLEAMADTIKQVVRSEDVASRFGGEEFCVLAIECAGDRLVTLAERLREAIEALRVDFKSECLSVTVSVGCCFLDPGRPFSAEGFLERADRALYASKSSGRNRTTLYRYGLLAEASVSRGRGA